MRIFLVAMLGLVVGCGVTYVPVDGTATPEQLGVTEQLRQACFPLPDANIRSYLILIDEDRRAGWTRAEELALASNCDTMDCRNCLTAVVYDVYSR